MGANANNMAPAERAAFVLVSGCGGLRDLKAAEPLPSSSLTLII